MAYFIGSVLGAMFGIYLISKLLEVVFLKRVLKNRISVILTSTTVSFFLVFVLWYSAIGKPYAQEGISLALYLLASLLLVAVRCRRAK
ncbi:hypothetical protein [Aeromonas caviae]|uniref:hypothetical protein n=1 Tax=Aeromonas caviae TaxID=648 RepID=UPI0030820482